MSEARTYGGWQQERVAFIFGLSGRQSVLLAGAVVAVMIPLLSQRISQAAVWWPAGLLLAGVALIRVQGRTADQWGLTASSYAAIRAQGAHRFAGGPYLAPAAREAGQDGVQLELPGILAPLRMLSVPAAGGDLAVVHHPYDRTYAAVARVRFPGIGLADSGRREQRVAGWGALLAGLCTEGSPVIRVQVLQRLVPESGIALRAWHEAHLAPGAPELAGQVAAELLASAPATASRRDAFLAVVIDAGRVRGQVRAAGGGDAGAAAVLVRQLRAVSQALAAADLEAEAWLGTRDLAEVIRTAFDPGARAGLEARRALAASAAPAGQPGTTLAPGVAPRVAGPVHAGAHPGSYRHDGAASVAYWVSEWPAEAYCTVLGPLLADQSASRSFGMVVEPLPPRAARRAVMRERTERHVAVRMRQRTGQIVPEDERAAMARAAQQDAERAAGHGLVRFAGYATVTVADPGSLEDACAALEADAAAARIGLTRMWFSQDAGFAAGALPLGIGLPRRRW